MDSQASYKGFEHSKIKHELLEAYLEKLFMIIGQTESTICYVDCFSGPWRESDEDLSGTSIKLVLNVMQNCRKTLKEVFKRNVKFKALFIEKDQNSYKKLEIFLDTHNYDGITTDTRKGEFQNLRQDILTWCDNNHFTFFFIDPKGWKHAIELPTLEPLLKRPNSEFLINFMYDFLVRTHTQQSFEEDMAAIFGKIPDTAGLLPKERERHLIRLYRENIKSIRPEQDKPRTAYVSILDRLKDRTKYHLVYLTRHHLGIVKFMEASEKMSIIQKHVRAQTKQERKFEQTGITDMFGVNPSLENNNNGVNLEEVKTYWLNHLSEGTEKFGLIQLADMMEETDWFQRDFQLAFKELLEEKKVENLDAKKKRPKNPIHFKENERLRRVAL